MAPDERRRWLASGADFHASELRSRVATWTSVLQVWSPHGAGQAANAIPHCDILTGGDSSFTNGPTQLIDYTASTALTKVQ